MLATQKQILGIFFTIGINNGSILLNLSVVSAERNKVTVLVKDELLI